MKVCRRKNGNKVDERREKGNKFYEVNKRGEGISDDIKS
jgi:hypothetical protein